MKEIAIQGFSPKQMAFADIIWGLETNAEVTAFLDTLGATDRKEALVVKDMLLLAFIDQVEEVDTAKKVLAQFTL